MNITNLQVSNFMRWRSLEFNLDSVGLNLIEGKNGHGKSSIFEAIVWCIFGKTLRGMSGDEVINTASGKDCFVSLEIQVADKILEIQRFRAHSQFKNELFLFVDGEDIRKWSNKSTQDDIETILGVDFTAFVNSVLFGGGLTRFFASLTDKEQKTVLDALTGVNIYDSALEVVKSEYNSVQQEVIQQQINLTRLENSITTFVADLEEANTKYKNWENDRNKRRQDKSNLLFDYSNKLEQSKTRIASNIELLRSTQTELQGLYEEKSKKVCQTCKQPLPFDKDAKIKELEKYISQLNSSIAVDKSNMSLYNAQSEQLQNDISAIEDEPNVWAEVARKLLSMLEENNEEIVRLKSLVAEMQEQLTIKSFWLDGFGNAGIKSLRLDSVAPFLTHKANEYSDLLTDGRIHISFQTQAQLKSGDIRDKFNVQIINQDGHSSHKGSSMGERRCVDLCILWSLQDLARSRVAEPINIEFYDEIMDILDEDNTEHVLTVLNNRAKERSVWVISHNDMLKGMFDTTFTVDKYSGESHIVRR